MGAERDGLRGGALDTGGAGPRRARGARTRALALLGCGALVLAGCASMPDSGDPTEVDQSPRAERDSQVRVYGVPPRDGASPIAVVRGFLDATTSDEERFPTARQYLAKSVRDTWDPFVGTNVLQDRPTAKDTGQLNREDSDGYTVGLSGSQIATVDSKHAYTPQEKQYKVGIHLIKEGDQWRIDRLPNGLVLGLSDFQRIYRSVNKYYFASYNSEAREARADKNVLVADPVYLRQRIDPVTASARALLEGPTNWLNQVTSTAFPTGTTLKDKGLSLDDSNALRVRLSKQAEHIETGQCRRMAAQLLYTVQDMTRASKISEVELQGESGGSLCVLTQDQANREFAPRKRYGHATPKEYFIDQDHRVVSTGDSGTEPTPVPGPFGRAKLHLRSVGVSRGEDIAAGVLTNGRALYVAPLQDGAEQGEVRLRSRSSDKNYGLTAPSWDGLGDLWIADADEDGSRLLRLRHGTEEPEEVSVPGLGERRIKAVRMAADGIRIALLVEEKGRTTLQLGRVERGGTPEHPKLAVQELRPIAPQLEDVAAASWAGGSRLVVVGRESGGVQQMQYMETDGSASNAQTLPGVNGVKAVAASEDESRPLLALAAEGIVRLPLDANWKTVAKDGTAPVYPG